MTSSFCLLLGAVAISVAIVNGQRADLEVSLDSEPQSTMDECLYRTLLAKMAAQGFKTEQMIRTSQAEDS